MPELPEVEMVARGLRKRVLKRPIAAVAAADKKTFRGTPAALRQFVVDQKFTRVERRAKWLILWLSSGYGFVVHLKMTGQLLVDDGTVRFLGGHTMEGERPTYPNHHTRVTFTFSDGGKLYFQDMRRFGYVKLMSAAEIEDYFAQKKLGLEPLDPDFTVEYLTTQLARRGKTTIKAALLDQSVVSGIGNIYADDTCFVAGIRPTRRVAKLTAADRTRLHAAARSVMQEAIDQGGTSFSHFLQVDGALGNYWPHRKVYDRTGEPCVRCGTAIQKIRVAGRGTHFCPNCQP